MQRVMLQFRTQLCSPRRWGNIGEMVGRIRGRNRCSHCCKEQWKWCGILFENICCKSLCEQWSQSWQRELHQLEEEACFEIPCGEPVLTAELYHRSFPPYFLPSFLPYFLQRRLRHITLRCCMSLYSYIATCEPFGQISRNVQRTLYHAVGGGSCRVAAPPYIQI